MTEIIIFLEDIVRHKPVKRIVRAYEQEENSADNLKSSKSEKRNYKTEY